ncbi:MAG: family 10 glycosylhydrolase [Tissierellia bacterium]|nr:family 10 glycosylhydrolase [Tissierellia bacterium]
MLSKSSYSKFMIFFLAMVLVLVALPTYSFAISNPWDPYKEYMQNSIAKRQLRGAWISTTLNLDWPSTETININNDKERIERTKNELIAILDKAVDMNMNAVFLQVSPEGDAFYKSDIVPWSRYLTGTFGKDPGFDPLAFAVEQAHKRNLEIHAWFNPYRVSMNTNSATIESLNIEKSVYREHPDWIRTAYDRFVVDPGIPEARKWVKDRVMEVVKKYDIDGIHFDDYFYHEKYIGELDDDNTFNKYNLENFSYKEDWRRNNTYLLIKEISQEIRKAKPWVKFGISPAAVWRNKQDDERGSNTRAGIPNYDRSFADTKKWVEEEIIDYIAPQVYFSFANPYVPYGEIASWWSNIIKDKNVHLYIGQALYKVNDDEDIYFKNNLAIEEFARQHKFNTGKTEVMGSIMFRFKNLYDANKQDVVNTIKNSFWSTKALVPVMDWKGGQAPARPTDGRIEALSYGNKLSWIDNDENTSYYAIYRTNKGNTLDINSNRAAIELIATVKKSNKKVQEFIDRTNSNLDDVVYAVTALDRLHHESKELIIGTGQSNYFYDVNRGQAWAIEAVDSLHEKDIINGVGHGKFAPKRNITRADFLIIVMNSFGIKADTHVTNNFSDAGNRYYTKYLGTAKNIGLVLGVGNNLFLPEKNMSRQDMFVVLYRVLDKLGKLPEYVELAKKFEDFSDIGEISDYAVEAIKYLVEAGLVQGNGSKLKPKAMATRAEAAQVIYNIISK